MLVMTRRIGEEIVIGENIHLSVVRVAGGKVRLGVIAPMSVRVQRAEMREKQAPRSSDLWQAQSPRN